MPRFGWMRLAYLLLVLTILVSLARVGGPDAEAQEGQPPPPAGEGQRHGSTRHEGDPPTGRFAQCRGPACEYHRTVPVGDLMTIAPVAEAGRSPPGVGDGTSAPPAGR